MKRNFNGDIIRNNIINNNELVDISMIEIIMFLPAMILTVDIVGFALWVVSGQIPLSDFYIGAITSNILKMVL